VIRRGVVLVAGGTKSRKGPKNVCPLMEKMSADCPSDPTQQCPTVL